MQFAEPSYRPRFRAFVTAAAVLITGIPVHAAPIDASTLDDAALSVALADAQARDVPRLCDELVPLTAEALRRAAPPANDETFEAGNAELWCAIEQKRYADATAVIERVEAITGRQANFDRVAISLHSFLEQPEKAIARIDVIATAADGAALTKIPPDLIYEISGKVSKARRSDLKLALWSSIYSARSFGQLDPDVIGGTGINLLQAKADAGLLSDKDSDLADLVTNASAYAALLAQKRYAPLWPHLEERAGEKLAEIILLDRKITAARFKAQPQVTQRFASAIYSMLQSGEFAQLIEATKAFREEGMDYDGVDEQIAWAINSMAIALRASGQPEEGIKALDRLASLDADKHAWIVNFAINHAAALAGEARHEEALKSYDRAQPIAEKQGSPYARAIIAGQRACSLQALGRSTEAADAFKVLEGMRMDAPSPAIGFAMCAGREDLAIAWALEGLADDTHRPSIISALQPLYMEGTPSAWNDPQPNLLLARSAELAAAFDRVARVVPERFAPLGGKERLGPKPAATQD
ncbi:MAG: tetratricopeptide repeat protein [Paracoccus sp.]|nr:tetratricopeptide repeat protein [Paracoccus sp. (in: a-proteobacteria)]